ncbi:MAG: VCBS repeat-containing protein [Phycisphaerales bacterium]
MTRHNLHVVAGTLVGLTASQALPQDVNGNALADSTEIRLGNAQDCNHNGVPDDVDATRPHFSSAVEHLNGVQAFQNNVWDAAPLELNADGLPDLALAVFTSTNFGSIALWRGNAEGPALTHITDIGFPNARPTYIRAADMNADGRDDIIAGDSSFNRAYVLLATGDETFAPPIILQGEASNNGMGAIDVGDLDNDGDVDVVTAAWGQDTISVFLNNGNGTFAPRATYAVDNTPSALDIGDVDGDGMPDVAVGHRFFSNFNQNATVVIMRNTGGGELAFDQRLTQPDGTGTFSARPEVRDVALADFDHDGDVDLFSSNVDTNVLAVWTNEGGVLSLAFTLGDGENLGYSAGRVLVTDLDDDGWEDVAWCDEDMYSVSVYRNVAGQLEFDQAWASGTAFSVAAADYSHDGLPDLVTTDDFQRTFSILASRGDLLFDGTVRVRPQPLAANNLLAEFTGDGLTDLGAFVPDGEWAVYPGVGDGRFSTDPILTNPFTSGRVLARDINADGVMDLLNVSGHCEVYLGAGDGTFAPAVSSPLSVNASRLAVADLDLDGFLDLAWIWPGHPSVMRVSFGDGSGAFGPYTEYTLLAEDESIGVGDITGDGAPELFSGHRMGHFLTLVNNGDGTFQPARDIVITGTPLVPAVDAIAIADFDTDGDNDAVVTAGGLRFFANPGDGSLPETPTLANAVGASELFVEDIDLDGVPDLYGQGGVVNVYLGNADGTFGVEFLHRYTSAARDITTGDADNDGRVDVMLDPENGWENFLYLNRPAQASDVNADGIPDSCQDICAADFAEPFGQLDFSDVVAFLTAFASSDTASDLAEPFGQWDFSDVVAFLAAFGAGCP